MKRTGYISILTVLLVSGCGTRSAGPRPLITRDDQGRVLRHVIFNPDHSVNTVRAFQYPDSGIALENATVYNGTNGWTVTETYNMLDSPVSLRKVMQYDADGNLAGENNMLVNPGSRPFKINDQP